MHGTHAATSKVENSAQGSSCKLMFVHDIMQLKSRRGEGEREGREVYKLRKLPADVSEKTLREFTLTPMFAPKFVCTN